MNTTSPSPKGGDVAGEVYNMLMVKVSGPQGPILAFSFNIRFGISLWDTLSAVFCRSATLPVEGLPPSIRTMRHVVSSVLG